MRESDPKILPSAQGTGCALLVSHQLSRETFRLPTELCLRGDRESLLSKEAKPAGDNAASVSHGGRVGTSYLPVLSALSSYFQWGRKCSCERGGGIQDHSGALWNFKSFPTKILVHPTLQGTYIPIFLKETLFVKKMLWVVVHSMSWHVGSERVENYRCYRRVCSRMERDDGHLAASWCIVNSRDCEDIMSENEVEAGPGGSHVLGELLL